MKKVTNTEVKNVLDRAIETDKEKSKKIIAVLNTSQPEIICYLTGIGREFFNESEQRWFLFLGINIWQMMIKVNILTSKITREILDENVQRSIQAIRKLKDKEHFEKEIGNIIKSNPQPEVIKYIIYSLDTIKEEEIRDKNKIIIFFFLKVLVDSFVHASAA